MLVIARVSVNLPPLLWLLVLSRGLGPGVLSSRQLLALAEEGDPRNLGSPAHPIAGVHQQVHCEEPDLVPVLG